MYIYIYMYMYICIDGIHEFKYRDSFLGCTDANTYTLHTQRINAMKINVIRVRSIFSAFCPVYF